MTKGQRTVAGMLAVIAVTLGPSVIVRGSPTAGAQGMGVPGCPWDCTGDGEVNVPDLLQLLADWGLPGSPCDFDGGIVAVPDLLKLLANWGLQCP